MQVESPACKAVRACAARNTESVGRLLLEFFWHYSFVFDTRRKAISVRAVSPTDVEFAARHGLPFPDSPFKDEKVTRGHWTQKSFLRYTLDATTLLLLQSLWCEYPCGSS